VGTVRDWVDLDEPDGHGPRTLWLEHHPAMTPLALEQLVQVAHARFDVQATRLIHRVGSLAPGDQIVLVAVASAHRGEAFAACMFLMDALKTQAPFWKKECVGETGQWVAACDSDDAAWLRWT
jgi:molybdopterin synthase catalytic subunit